VSRAHCALLVWEAEINRMPEHERGLMHRASCEAYFALSNAGIGITVKRMREGTLAVRARILAERARESAMGIGPAPAELVAERGANDNAWSYRDVDLERRTLCTRLWDLECAPWAPEGTRRFALFMRGLINDYSNIAPMVLDWDRLEWLRDGILLDRERARVRRRDGALDLTAARLRNGTTSQTHEEGTSA
jgi:hypothetical protein